MHAKKGDRIRLLQMTDEVESVSDGALGTVETVTQLGAQCWRVEVKWDRGEGLSLSVPPDKFEIVR